MRGAWLFALTSRLSLTAWLAPVEVPAPTISEQDPDADAANASATIEGPTRAPVSDEASELEAADEVPGIEFAPPPMVGATVGAEGGDTDASSDEANAASSTASPPEVWWPDPGHAPADGAGFFVTGGLLVPTAAIVTWGLLRESSLSSVDRSGIIVAGSGMGLLGLIGIGMGAMSRRKLVRWANAYRVIPEPQGGGLLALGGLGATAGLTLVPLGAWLLARGGSPWTGGAMLGVGALAGGVLAPVGLIVGGRRRDAWRETGGWRRRPIPELVLTPSVSFSEQAFGVAVRGRF